jgi:hypothetical protein
METGQNFKLHKERNKWASSGQKLNSLRMKHTKKASNNSCALIPPYLTINKN